jgi:putative DNA primase/helicase
MKPFDKGFTDEELDFEITEPVIPPTPVIEIPYVELLGEFLDLPAKKEEQEILCKTIYDLIEDCIRNKTEVRIARMIKQLYQGKIVYVGDGIWYMFENKSWIRDDKDATRSVISNKTYKVFEKITKHWLNVETEDEELSKEIANRIKTLTNIQLKLESTTDKTNIYKEMKEVCLNAEFAKEFNLAKDVLPIKNGLLFNLTNNTTRERTIADKFDYECPVDFVASTENGKKYMTAIFCDDNETLQVFCDVIKSCVSGRQLRKVFICSGSGSNGKSLLFKKMKKSFGKGMDTLSKKLFIETKQTASLNTEYEKLDKIRIGFISEVEDEDKLNQSAVKTISGGDEINLRTLFKTDTTIQPTANLFMCVNVEPKFDAEISVVRRLVNFPFNATFQDDASYEAKVDGWLSEIFSYIMTTGKLIDVVVPSPAMIAKKEEHQNAQVDSLKEFIADRIIKVEDETKKITNNDFYKDYVYWCKTNHQSYPTIKAVSRRITSFGITKKESGGKTWYYGVEFKEEDVMDTDNK